MVRILLDNSMLDYSYNSDFRYTHDNPYHDKLALFENFVMRDQEAEQFRDQWNEKVFKRAAPLCVEIGTGYGHFMLEYCRNNPHENFVGLDYRFKRSYSLAKQLSAIEAGQFKYLRAKGERIHFQFGDSEVDKIYYFFPDPWPKNRHHKKRLFQEPFLAAAYKILKPNGKIFIKTDHDEYAQWMKKVIDKDRAQAHKKNGAQLFDCELASLDLRAEYPKHFLCSFETKFEKIFLAKKIKIKGFVLKSKKGAH